jgi:hypothetical protein
VPLKAEGASYIAVNVFFVPDQSRANRALMPDPMSIISATALALHTAQVTKDFVDGILNAPETVTAIVRDLAALETVLQHLDEQLKKDAFLKNPINVNIVPTVQQPLQNCTADSQQIKELLRKICEAVWCSQVREMERAHVYLSRKGAQGPEISPTRFKRYLGGRTYLCQLVILNQ